MKKIFVSTCVRRLAPLRFTEPVLLNCQCTRQECQVSIRTFCSTDLPWRFLRTRHPPASTISSDSPELKQTTFCFLAEAHTRCHVPSVVPLTQTAIPEQLRRSLTCAAPSAPVIHHQDRTLRCTRNSKTIQLATNDLVAETIPNQIPQQTFGC